MNLDLDRVPTRFEEALEMLDSSLTPREKQAWTGMTAAKMFDLQEELAAILREAWSLDDSDTPLRIHFRNLGLDDPRELSMLLVDAYWRKYNREPFTVPDLVREYLEE